METDPTSKDLDARLKLNEVEKRRQLLERLKSSRAYKNFMLRSTLLLFSSIMMVSLWLVFKANQPMLLGVMACNAYTFAVMIGVFASNRANQRIDDLVALIGDDKLLDGKE